MSANAVAVEIVESPDKAPNYREQGDWIGVAVEKIVIVQKGTVNGSPAIDIQLVDETGKKYVGVLTAQLFMLVGGMVMAAEESACIPAAEKH